MWPLAGLFAAWLVAPAPGMTAGASVVLGERGGTLVAGTERGLFVDSVEGWLRQSVRGSVSDLVQGPDGLWVAAGGVLYAWPSRAAAPRAVSLGAGASVRSLAVADPRGSGRDLAQEIWVATEVGLFRRAPGGRFEREASIPAGRVAAVRVSGDEVWASARSQIWRRRPQGIFESVVRAQDPRRWKLIDVARLPGGDRLLAVSAGIWRLRSGGELQWLSVPDRELTGLEASGAAIWLAGSQGLTRYRWGAQSGTLESPLRILVRPVLAVERSSRTLRIATSTGVVQVDREAVARGGREPQVGTGPLALSATRSKVPPGAADFGGSFWSLGSRVLRYQGLEPRAFRQLESRSRGAGWLPVLRATLGIDHDRASDRGHDQTFSSGATHDLLDRGRKRATGLSLDLQLTWSLARLRDPGDAIAISRERRERSELRDQVLDRVTRLYFERERLLARLSDLAPEAPERSSLEIRERELRAGLDAWSGGHFSRRLAGTDLASGRRPSPRLAQPAPQVPLPQVPLPQVPLPNGSNR